MEIGFSGNRMSGWQARSTGHLFAQLQFAALKLRAAQDVELERLEGGRVGVIEDEMNVFVAQHLELVQTDEDVAALNAGPIGGAVRANVRHGQAAAELRVTPCHGIRTDRPQA